MLKCIENLLFLPRFKSGFVYGGLYVWSLLEKAVWLTIY